MLCVKALICIYLFNGLVDLIRITELLVRFVAV